MKVTDLVEYSPKQLNTLAIAQRLGCDIKHLIRPMSDENLEAYYKIAIYNIPDKSIENIQDEENIVEKLSQYTQSLWFRRELNTKQMDNKVTKYIDLKYQKYILEMYAQIDGYFKEQILQLMTLNVSFHAIWNGNLVTGLYNIYTKTTDEVMQDVIDRLKPENTREKHEILKHMKDELEKTGTVNIFTDKNYNKDELLTIMRIYEETGIDVRLIPDFDLVFATKEFKKTDYVTNDITNFMINTYTTEGLRVYRERSNEFRYNSEIETGLTH